MIITLNKISDYSGKIIDFLLDNEIRNVKGLSALFGIEIDTSKGNTISFIKLYERNSHPRIDYTIKSPINIVPLTIDIVENRCQKFTLRTPYNMEGYNLFGNQDRNGNYIWSKIINGIEGGEISGIIRELGFLGGKRSMTKEKLYNGPERRKLDFTQ